MGPQQARHGQKPTEPVLPTPVDPVAEIDCLIRIFDDGSRIHLVSDKLVPEQFFDPVNEWIYRAALAVSASGQQINTANVHAWLLDRRLPDGRPAVMLFEGTAHRTLRERLLADIALGVAEMSVEDAARRIREKHALRQMIGLTGKLTIEAHGDVGNVEDYLATVQHRVEDVVREFQEGAADDDTVSLYDGSLEIWNDITSERTREFVTTGCHDLDADLGGFEYGMVTTIGAATNWGKTHCAVMFADECELSGKRALVVAFEDKPELYVRRLVARRSRISMWGLKERKLSDNDKANLVQFVNEQGKRRRPFVLNARGRPVESVIARVRSLCRTEKIDLIIWDYLQAMKSRYRITDKRERVEYCFREVVDVTKQIGAAGVVISQLTRLEPSVQPTIFHLKESGDIENGSDVIILGSNDDDGVPRLRLAKSKDSAKNEDYGLVWDTLTASFRAGRRIAA